MKLATQFTQDSDPIDDMGIGVDHLIKKWVETETKFKYDENNLLWICSREGKVKFVKYLLDKGYDVHFKDDVSLRLASQSGHSEIVKMLLDAGADVHVYNNDALRWASHYGHIEIVKLLLDAGADVHADNNVALRLAKRYNHVKIVKLFQNHINKQKNEINYSIYSRFRSHR